MNDKKDKYKVYRFKEMSEAQIEYMVNYLILEKEIPKHLLEAID